MEEENTPMDISMTQCYEPMDITMEEVPDKPEEVLERKNEIKPNDILNVDQTDNVIVDNDAVVLCEKVPNNEFVTIDQVALDDGLPKNIDKLQEKVDFINPIVQDLVDSVIDKASDVVSQKLYDLEQKTQLEIDVTLDTKHVEVVKDIVDLNDTFDVLRKENSKLETVALNTTVNETEKPNQEAFNLDATFDVQGKETSNLDKTANSTVNLDVTVNLGIDLDSTVDVESTVNLGTTINQQDSVNLCTTGDMDSTIDLHDGATIEIDSSGNVESTVNLDATTRLDETVNMDATIEKDSTINFDITTNLDTTVNLDKNGENEETLKNNANLDVTFDTPQVTSNEKVSLNATVDLDALKPITATTVNADNEITNIDQSIQDGSSTLEQSANQSVDITEEVKPVLEVEDANKSDSSEAETVIECNVSPVGDVDDVNKSDSSDAETVINCNVGNRVNEDKTEIGLETTGKGENVQNKTVIEILDDEDEEQGNHKNDTQTILIEDSVSDVSFKSFDDDSFRTPLKKIDRNSGCKTAKTEPELPIKDEVIANKENLGNFDLSIFSNSPAKIINPRRGSIFSLFDPLYIGSPKQQTEQDKLNESVIPEQAPVLREDRQHRFTSTLLPLNEDLIPPPTSPFFVVCEELKTILTDETNAVSLDEFLETIPVSVKKLKTEMDDISEQKMLVEQELNELKLQLNQVQQERATSEKELLLKDEVILKMQGESQKKEGQYKQEIKQLCDKLHNINEQNNNEEAQSLKQEIIALKEDKAQLTEKLNRIVDTEMRSKKTINDYEVTISHMVSESDKLKSEHERAKQHLATLEIAFSDVHSKYERSKEIITGYKNNEETLLQSLEKSNQTARKTEERYESLKAHAKAQIERANKDLAAMKEKHQSEMGKLTNVIKRLEIKNGSIQLSLDQKTKECAALAALCDEMTGSVPQ